MLLFVTNKWEGFVLVEAIEMVENNSKIQHMHAIYLIEVTTLSIEKKNYIQLNFQ